MESYSGDEKFVFSKHITSYKSPWGCKWCIFHHTLPISKLLNEIYICTVKGCLHIFVGGEGYVRLSQHITSPPTKLCKHTLLLSHLNPPSPPFKKWSPGCALYCKKINLSKQFSSMLPISYNDHYFRKKHEALDDLLAQYTIAQNIMYINMLLPFKGLAWKLQLLEILPPEQLHALSMQVISLDPCRFWERQCHRVGGVIIRSMATCLNSHTLKKP